jgi:GntR family transcriptional regulator, transcriptional repressor for pyruvate dehydrogenase complex
MTDTRRLYQQTADRVRLLIAKGDYQPGARLPAERELAQQLGVSRPSLREALIALEIAGIYVLNTTKPSGNGRSLGESPSELMQARAVIESAIIVQAAASMTGETLAALRAILAAMADDIANGRKPIEQDRAFHIAIAESAGNTLLAEIVTNLFDERHSPLSAGIRGHFETTESWTAALVEHHAVLAALEARDPLAAQAAMHSHLTASGRRWLEN